MASTAPDVVCLQELKAPKEKTADAGYHAIWHGQKSWNGVANLSPSQEIMELWRIRPGGLKMSRAAILRQLTCTQPHQQLSHF